MLQIDDDGFDNFFMCFFSTKPVVITSICACRSLIEYFNLEHITVYTGRHIRINFFLILFMLLFRIGKTF